MLSNGEHKPAAYVEGNFSEIGYLRAWLDGADAERIAGTYLNRVVADIIDAGKMSKTESNLLCVVVLL